VSVGAPHGIKPRARTLVNVDLGRQRPSRQRGAEEL
jgi:hypothetical protein